jgi:anhydro-N-acetylmuramic acid kinase
MDQMYAFDTGPGNMIMDEVTKRLQGQKYDKGGYFASLGKVNEDMLKELMSIEYINAQPPKTTGREFFGSQFVDRLLEKWGHLQANDIISTVTMFTAKSIALNYRKFVFNIYPIDEVILGGGGSL